MKFSIYLITQLIMSFPITKADTKNNTKPQDSKTLSYVDKAFPDIYEVKKLVDKDQMSVLQKNFTDKVLLETGDIDTPVEGSKTYHIFDRDFSKKFEATFTDNVNKNVEYSEFASTESFSSVSSIIGTSSGGGGGGTGFAPTPLTLKDRFMRDFNSIKLNSVYKNAYATWIATFDGQTLLTPLFKNSGQVINEKYNIWKEKTENKKTTDDYINSSDSIPIFNTWVYSSAGKNALKDFFDATQSYTSAFSRFQLIPNNVATPQQYVDSPSSNSKFITWSKTQDGFDRLKDEFKKTTGNAPQYEAKLASWILANPKTISEYISDGESTSTYDKWISMSAGQDALKSFFTATSQYRTALNAFRNEDDTQASPAQYADDVGSNSKYTTWVSTKNGFDALKDTFKSTSGNSLSYQTNKDDWIANNYKTTAQYAAASASTSVYNKWIASSAGRGSLKTFFNASNGFTTAYNTFKNKAANQKLVDDYVISTVSNSKYNTWVATKDGFDAIKNIFKASKGVSPSYEAKAAAWIVANPKSTTEYLNHADSTNVFNTWRTSADGQASLEPLFKADSTNFNAKLLAYQNANLKTTDEYWTARKDTNVFTQWVASSDGKSALEPQYDATTGTANSFATKYLSWLKHNDQKDNVINLWQSNDASNTTFNLWRKDKTAAGGWESIATIWKATSAGQTAKTNYPKVEVEFSKLEYDKTTYGTANSSEADFDEYSKKSVALRKYEQFNAYTTKFFISSSENECGLDFAISATIASGNVTSLNQWINAKYSTNSARTSAKERVGNALTSNGIDFNNNDDTFNGTNLFEILKTIASETFSIDTSASKNSNRSWSWTTGLQCSTPYSSINYNNPGFTVDLIFYAPASATGSSYSNVLAQNIPGKVKNIQYKINGMVTPPNWYKSSTITTAINNWSADKKNDTTNKDGATPQNDIKTLFNAYIKANKTATVTTWVENNFTTNVFSLFKTQYKGTSGYSQAYTSWVTSNKNTTPGIKSSFAATTSSVKLAGDDVVKANYKLFATPSQVTYEASDTFSNDASQWGLGKKTSNASVKAGFKAAMTSAKTNGDQAVKAAYNIWKVKTANDYEATGRSGAFGSDLATWAKTIKNTTTGLFSIDSIKNKFIAATASTSANGNKTVKDAFDVWKIPSQASFKNTPDYFNDLTSWATGKKLSTTPNIKAKFIAAMDGSAVDTSTLIGHNEVKDEFDVWKVKTSAEYEATGQSGQFGTDLATWADTLKNKITGYFTNPIAKASFIVAAKSTDTNGNKAVKDHFDSWRVPDASRFQTSRQYKEAFVLWATGKKASTTPNIKAKFTEALDGTKVDTAYLTGHNDAKYAFEVWKPKTNVEYEATGKSGAFGTDLATWAATTKHQSGIMLNKNVKAAFSLATTSTSTSGDKDVKDHFDTWKQPSEETFKTSYLYTDALRTWALTKKADNTDLDSSTNGIQSVKSKFVDALDGTTVDTQTSIGHNVVKETFDSWRTKSLADYYNDAQFLTDLNTWISTSGREEENKIKELIGSKMINEQILDSNTKSLVESIKPLIDYSK